MVTLTTSARDRLTAMVSAEPERLRRRSLSLGVHPNDADDAAQEVLVKAWRSVDTLHSSDQGQVCSWLDAIARRTAIDLARRDKKCPDTGVDQEVVATRTTEQSVEERDRLERVVEAIRMLPDALRDPLVLATTENLTTDEIARQLGISPAAARQRLSRARRAIGA